MRVVVTMRPAWPLPVLLLALAAGPAAVPPAVAPDRPVRLFNGKDLSGLYTFLQDTKRDDPRRVFGVTPEGWLRVSGDGFGYVSTDRAYRDYRLVVEFKWGTRNWRGREGKARDSGIFLHAAGPDGNSFDAGGAYKAAVECNVMQGAVGDLLLINGKAADGSRVPVAMTAEAAPGRDADGWPTWKKGGAPVTLDRGGRLNWSGKDARWRDVLDFRGAADVEGPPDAWTRVECVCDGGRITVRVNGTVVNEARDVTPREGPILLQCEGSEVFFRTFELHPLTNR
jgi:hypothetical protein